MKTYDELTLADDFMFSKIFSDESLCSKLIELLLNIKVSKIEYFNSQSSINEDYLGHGVRFDVYVKDSDKIYDIEMQTVNTGDLIERARYYQAMIDIDTLKKSTSYSALKETYIIFICTFDPFNQGLSKYTVHPKIIEAPTYKYNDKTTKVFYNSSAYKNTANKEVKAFLEYLTTQSAKSNFTQFLQKAVYTAKGNEPWRRNYMTLAMKYDEWKNRGLTEGLAAGRAEGKAIGLAEGKLEGKAIGLAEGKLAGLAEGKLAGLAEGEKIGISKGAEQNKLETAKIALANNISLDMIQKLTGLSLEQIKKLQTETLANA